ncbi:hypothetical protein LCGC14_1458380 [marine sediment metagenome]|uniref:Uncharacterized protein n=1 Tax=marine sediment metagenome TaxID=412755 RepID=A0A0F9JFS4_9ZZZZ
MDDDIQFANMDSWRGSGGGKYELTFKQIVLTHLNRCVVNGSVEFHGGYWNKKSAGQYMSEEIYIHNSREVYCNSVKMLRALLLGYFDKKIIDEDKKINEDITKAFEDYEKDKDKNARGKYYEKKVELYIKLFESLVILSKRLNFFQEIEEDEYL